MCRPLLCSLLHVDWRCSSGVDKSDLFDLDFSHLAISVLPQTVIYSIPNHRRSVSRALRCSIYSSYGPTHTTKLFCCFIRLPLGSFVGSPAQVFWQRWKTRTAASLFTLNSLFTFSLSQVPLRFWSFFMILPSLHKKFPWVLKMRQLQKFLEEPAHETDSSQASARRWTFRCWFFFQFSSLEFLLLEWTRAFFLN